MDPRQSELSTWCASQCALSEAHLEIVSGDASFRRYFRLTNVSPTLIAMDAPPDKEASDSFVAIAESWRTQVIPVPEIIAHDLSRGFLLLEDFGNQVLLDALEPPQPNLEKADHFYREAINSLLSIQTRCNSNPTLPLYSAELLDQEMALFKDWLVVQKLELTLADNEHKLLADSFETLKKSALGQPQVCVHRDYHSRNLMVLPEDRLGILDFQDAVKGPVSYDLVSLLRDCYIAWPDAQVDAWCLHYYRLASEQGLIQTSPDMFTRWFDFMGMQRHLKASGIFARLSLRDGKHGYLHDIPRTLNYLHNIALRYSETEALGHWLQERILPALAQMDRPE